MLILSVTWILDFLELCFLVCHFVIHILDFEQRNSPFMLIKLGLGAKGVDAAAAEMILVNIDKFVTCWSAYALPLYVCERST